MRSARVSASPRRRAVESFCAKYPTNRARSATSGNSQAIPFIDPLHSGARPDGASTVLIKSDKYPPKLTNYRLVTERCQRSGGGWSKIGGERETAGPARTPPLPCADGVSNLVIPGGRQNEGLQASP